MSKSPYIPFYTSDFLGGTSGMTSATKGVYITLLCLMYEAEGPLSQSWDTIARRCGCTLPAFKKAVSVLEDDGKIALNNGKIWSDKCEKHLTQRRERSDSAKASAKKRWQKDEQNQSGLNADAMRTVCYSEPEPEIEKRNLKVPKKRGTRLSPDWTLTTKNNSDAKAKGLSPDEVMHEADQFRDYWISKPGAAGCKLDWDATWRNWCGNAVKRRSKRNQWDSRNPLEKAFDELGECVQGAQGGNRAIPNGSSPNDRGTIIELEAVGGGIGQRQAPGPGTCADDGADVERLFPLTGFSRP